ncbi:MAG: GNAT family N-acetyltransferase [Chloroflexi bacterium]|nr:GNAT family N-acetyltransferase [Chloroflexota bacterium]
MTDVRAAILADLPAVQDVDRSLDQRVSEKSVIKHAIEGGRVAVALDGDELSGYLRWEWFWDRVPLCVFVRVRPSHQRTGLGRALYAHVEADLARRGCDFWLSSTEETNDRSLRFHRALGFRLVGALSDLGQDSREIFMRKDLAQ